MNLGGGAMPKRAAPAFIAAGLILGAAPAALRGRPPVFPVEPAGGSVLRLVEADAPAVRRPPAAVPPALADLLSRVPRPEYWRDPVDPSCPVTWAHESTHGMTSELSAGRRWSMYLLDGKAVEFDGQPAVTIRQVAAAIPPADRGPIFDLYLVKQAGDWNEEPLYLLDEWNCYVHGSIARRQAGLATRQETERYAAEMERYCRAMLGVVEKLDPDYGDLDQLRAFIRWQADRFDALLDADAFVLR